MLIAWRNPSHSLASLFRKLRDALMPAIARHLDQAEFVVAVPLRIGAGIEAHLHGVHVSRTHGEMHRLGVPILRATQLRISIEQLP
jgi:hypothetical protein